MEGRVQSPPEGIHLGNFIRSGSSSILAPFLEPFAKFLASLGSGVHLRDRLQLGLRQNELFIKITFEGSPGAVVCGVLCQSIGNLIASPLASAGPKFEMGKGSQNPGFFVGEGSGIHGVIIV